MTTRKLTTLLSLLISVNTFAQSTDTLFMSKLDDKNWTANYNKKSTFKTIKFLDGSVLSLGDDIIIGDPTGGSKSTQGVGILAAGDSRQVNTYNQIVLGKFPSNIWLGLMYLPQGWKGTKIKIVKLSIFLPEAFYDGPAAALMFIDGDPGLCTVIDVSKALNLGEIINPVAAMTSDQALDALKKAKDKLDLGLISQQEYDSIKSELSKLIK